jgi:GMP synthase (glutamine-hydrolysing)
MIINQIGEQEPFQTFAAITDEIANRKVTGIANGRRTYEYPLCEKGEWNYQKLTQKASEIIEHSRLLFELYHNPKGRYDVIIRSVNSKDARTASVTNLPLQLLLYIKEKLLEYNEIKFIYFDVTSKPPATIEYV